MKLIKKIKGLINKIIPFKKKSVVFDNISNILHIIVKMTPNKMDNAVYALVAALIRSQTKQISEKDKAILEEEINFEDKGPLKDLSVKLTKENKVVVGGSFGGVVYDFQKGSFEWEKVKSKK